MKPAAILMTVMGSLLLVWSALPALTAQPAAPASGVQLAGQFAVGIVDLGRLNTGYRGIQQLNEDFQGFQKEQESKLQERMKTRMLSDDEQREYTELSTVSAPTDANRTRQEALAKLSDEREQHLGELEKKQARTPAEQKDYDELNKTYSARLSELTKLQSDLQQAALAKRDELMKVIDDSVNGAIRAVAEQRKLTVVLAREAVRFGGTDITDEVLTRLNAEPSPKPTTPAAAPASTPAVQPTPAAPSGPGR